VSLHYFDHAASAPRREEVFEAMAPFQRGVVGNPSGTHRAARASRRALEDAREQVADLLGAAPGGVVFTGGGTESCHLGVVGAWHARRARTGAAQLVVSPVEHHAVLDSARGVVDEFADASLALPSVDADGVVELDSLEELLSERTGVVSVMAANNETGVLQPLDAVADLVRRCAPGAVTHTDAIAAAPWLDLASATAAIDLVSICAHKLGGPVNAGALVVRGSTALDAVAGGGGQERGRRGGTVDVAAAVGLATALALATRERAEHVEHARAQQRRLLEALTRVDGVAATAPHAAKLPGHVHVTVAGLASDEILFLLDQAGVCASAASSCASGAGTASHVLAAMGVAPERARGAVRFTLGPQNTDEDVAVLIEVFAAAVARLRDGR
jgi:cysteine desulfurase